MKNSDIIGWLTSPQDDSREAGIEAGKLQEVMSSDFREGFEDGVLARINSGGKVYGRVITFERSFNLAFCRIAFTAAAAVVILMLSIYIKEGSFTIDSLLGIGDIDSESIVCLLTGN